jgi:uncharacterized protein
MTRPLWLAFGVLNVAAGAAGVVLPLVPTTPFLLLAAYCFARSSPRLHAWLLEHPRFGPLITDWQQHGSIARRAKITAVTLMALTFAGSVAFGLKPWIIAVQAVVLAASATYIVTRPEGPAAEE